MSTGIRLIVLAMLISPLFLAAQNNPNIRYQQQPRQQDKSTEKLARDYYFKKQYDKAVVLFEDLYKKKPTHNYYTYYVNCLLALKEYKIAEKVIKKQRRAYPTHPRYTIDLVHVYQLTGNEKKSNQLLNKLLNNLPNTRSGIMQIASPLMSKGYYKAALDVYKKGKEINVEGYQFHMELATAYQYNGQYNMMFSSYLAHLRDNPRDMQRIKNSMQNLMRLDVDDNLAQTLKKQLLGLTQAYPDNQVYAHMLLWHAMQTKDFDMAYRQARANDKRFGGAEIDVLDVADIALKNEAYEVAAQAYEYIRDKESQSIFYAEAYNGLYTAQVLKAESHPDTPESDYVKLEKEGRKAIKELGVQGHSLDVAQQLAHIQAFRLAKFEEARALLEEALKIPSLQAADLANIKLELADILMVTDKIWDASLLYAQVESEMKHEPIGHEAKFRNAKLFYYVSEFTWAQTRLDVLKSSTSKLIANDALELSLFISDILEEDTMGFSLRLFGAADLYLHQQHYDSSLMMLDKIQKQPSGPASLQYVQYKKAGIMMETGNYEEADALYADLVVAYPQSIKADNATFHRAEIHRLQFMNTEEAMRLYMKLMTDYPDSMYAGEARIKYRALEQQPQQP